MNQNKIEEMLCDTYFQTMINASGVLETEDFIEMIEATESIFDADFASLIETVETETLIANCAARSARDVCIALNMPRIINRHVKTH